MKITKNTTGYVLLKVQHNSLWDNCDFAIIEVSADWQKVIKERLMLLQHFSTDESFYCLSFWDVPLIYFINNAKNDDLLKFLHNEQKTWSFVMLEDELDSLQLPENRLDAHQLVLTAGNCAHYKAYGKHTGEEFWTSSFDLSEILKALKPN